MFALISKLWPKESSTKTLLLNTIRKYSEYSRNTLIDPAIGLTSGERQLQSMAYEFAINEFRPNMREWDEKEIFPIEKLRKAAQLGFGGLYTRPEVGGTGLSRLETSVVIEALSQGCVSTTALLSIHNMVCWMISEFGSQEQTQTFMSSLVSMQRIGAYCLTEPDSGSDASSLKTNAKRNKDYYILNGSKSFISGGGESDVFLIMCRTSGSGPKGISCLIVEKGMEGLSFGAKEKKMGWNSQPTRMVILEDCKVPLNNLLGPEGYGFNIAMQGINGGRLNIASCSLGGAQWALEETIQHTCLRKQFDRPIADFQNTQFQLASMATELLSSRLSVRNAAKAMDHLNNKRLNRDSNSDSVSDSDSDSDECNIPVSSLCAMSKVLATEKCFTIIDNCLQLFGGYGYLADYPIQQLLRDTRVHRILEGTNEIMKVIIARDLLTKHLNKY